jgi:hypothetical protein
MKPNFFTTVFALCCLSRRLAGRLRVVLLAAAGLGGVLSWNTTHGGEEPTANEWNAEPERVRQWAGGLTVANPADRAKTADLLVAGGAAAIPLLRSFLADPDEMLRREVVEIIRRLGPLAVPLLVELLASEEAFLRLQAVGILIDLAPETESAQPALARTLQDADPLVARVAAWALGALG